MSFLKKLFFTVLIALLPFFGTLLFSCSAVMNEVINDNKFSDGDYFFVLYKYNESSISAYGTMSIYYMSSDSTITGSYKVDFNKNNIFDNSKGGIIGKANWNSGEAKLKLGNSYFNNFEITLNKNIDIISGNWSSGYTSGVIYAFKNKN